MTPAEIHQYRSEAVPLIYEHLWLGKVPPRSPDKRQWGIARDLNIWNRLVDAGFRPEDINGAIAQVRRLRSDWAGEKLRMTVFYWTRQGGFCATPFLEECIGESHKRQDRAAREAKHVRLPPTVSDVLRQVIG